MATSYGMITITDTTDLGQLTVYLTGSTVRQQVYDNNTNPVSYYPDWSASGAHLLITPHIYFNGQSQPVNNNSNVVITWSKEEEGQTYSLPVSPTTDRCPETVNNNILERPTNLFYPDTEHQGANAHIIGTGITYKATITYYPIEDRSVTLQGIATLDLTIANNGLNGDVGAPAKLFQLIGDGSYFTYRYDGELFGSSTLTLTVQKNAEISGQHWYCKSSGDSDNGYVPIKVINGNPSTDSTSASWAAAPYYTGDSLTLAGESIAGQLDIFDLVPDFLTDRGAQFKIVEINSSGVELNSGMKDYTSIYALMEAAPGASTYSSYLSNDEETIVEIDGSPVLDNAQTQLFISQGGVDDMENWHITVNDSVADANDLQYTLSHSDDSVGSSYNLNKFGPDKVQVTAMNVNAALITFTAVHGSYDVNDVFTPDGSVSNIIKTFSLTKSAAIISHSLRLDSVNSVRTGNTYNPSSIVVDAITRRGGGGGTPSYRDAGVIRAVVYYTDGTSSPYTNSSGEALTLNLNTIGASKIINYIDTMLGGTAAQLYTDAEDRQKITISANGVDGTSPWNFMIGNQFDGISTGYDNKTTESFTIIIPVSAAQGTTPETIHYGSTYPTISAGSPVTSSNTTLSSITPSYYNGDTRVTTSGSTVTNVRYTINANTDIGASGSITLTLTYEANKTLTQVYTYKAQPSSLKSIRVLLDASPSDTFENQTGNITITPLVLTGTDEVPISQWSIPTGFTAFWYAYVNGSWVSATGVSGITMNSSTKVLTVAGTAVEGYLGLRFNVSITRSAGVETYTEYINLKDIDDPLQVSLHSTLGEQLINGQGVGVIYARVIRKGDEEDYDTVVPDNMLAVGTSAPTSSTASGKTGYCYVVLDNSSPPKPTGEIRYYWRSTGSGSWTGYRGNSSYPYQYTYTWYFRDSNNASYGDNSNTPTALRYVMNHNQQFIYLDSSVVSNKLTAICKVEL